MKNIYHIIFSCLLLIFSSSVAYAQLSTSGTWTSQTIEGTQSVELDGDIKVKGPIIIAENAVLNITRVRATNDDAKEKETYIKPDTDFTKHPDYPPCIFFVKQGGTLNITGDALGTSFISVTGSGYNLRKFAAGSNGENLYSDFQSERTIVRDANYYDFSDPSNSAVGGGLICAVGNVNLRYVKLYGLYASSGRTGVIYRPERTNEKKYIYGKVIVKDSQISSNIASYGGVIMVEAQMANANDVDANNTPDKCSVEFENVSISNNITLSTSDAGAIRTSPRTVGNLILKGCNIYQNYTRGNGGAIYWNAKGHENTTLIISGGSITKNQSRLHGAGLMIEGSARFEAYSESGELRDKRCHITKNIAGSDEDPNNPTSGNGGGVYIRTKGITSSPKTPIQIDLGNYVSVQNNIADNGAGVAIDFAGASVFPNGTEIDLNLEGADISVNTASQNGGGVYLSNNNTSNIINVVIDNNDISNTTIKGNVAGTSGGGIYLEKGDQTPDLSKISIKLNGAKLQGNAATNGAGGGVYLKGLNVISDQDATGIIAAGNTCMTNGGGICVDGTGGGVSMTISNGIVGKYDADDGNYGGNIASTGGGIYIKNATLTINGGEIISNKSTNSLRGGGGVAAENSVVTVSGGSILDNDSGSAHGGGLFLKNCTTEFNGGEISGNKTERSETVANTGFGGGVYVLQDGGTSVFNLRGTTHISQNSSYAGGGIYLNGGTANINGGIVSGNTSVFNGGGIYVGAGSLTLTDGTVSENISQNDGGGITFNSNGKSLIINGGKISSNTARANGGGIQVANGSLTISGGVIDRNTSTNAHGGGISFIPEVSAQMVLNNGVISNNTSYSNAGGIYFASGTLTIKGGEVFGNVAGQEGGGMSMKDHVVNQQVISQATSATISGGKFYNNSANLGGGIHLETAGTMTIDGGEIYQNSCTYQGGGINVEKSGGVTITNGTIRNNEAIHGQNSGSGNGGGILLGANGGHLLMNGGTIMENIGYSGAGICITGGTCAIEDGVIDKNVASQNGGGLMATSALSIEMTGGQISNNVASVGGGVFLISGAQLTFNDGLIINNKATCDDDSLAPETGKDWNPGSNNYQGLGGGVCVANAKLVIGNKTSVGIYANLADVLGDDIYSTGLGGSNSVYLPNIKKMNLVGYQAATTDLQWMEDYANGDTGYAGGTKANGANGYVPKRYRQALADKENVYAVDIPDVGKTFTGTYLALALGYDIMHLTLQRKGLMKGENAIYKISRWDETNQEWVTYAQVLVSGPQEATTKELASELVASKTIAVYAGKWRVEEIGWDWSYTGTSAIERELSSATRKEDRYFIFDATKDTDISASQHSESVVVNEFNRSDSEIIIKTGATITDFDGKTKFEW